MIKTKEDLHRAYIDGGNPELKSKLLEAAAHLKLGVNPYIKGSSCTALGIDIEESRNYFYQIEHNGDDNSYFEGLGYKELTLEDFTEDSDKESPTPKYKYTPLEVKSVFDLKEHLENGNLLNCKPDSFLEMCRVVLRATGELK